MFNIHWVLVAFMLVHFLVASLDAVVVDPKKTKIWGPGLVADATLPVRFMHIHPYDTNNNPIQQDLGDGAFQILVASGNKPIRAWRQVLNLHNGTYIARFRLYDFGGDLDISVMYNNKHVAKSPYKLKNVYGEECYCPMSFKKWISALQCPGITNQTKEDLKIFEKIDLTDLVSKGIPKFGAQYSSFCHYVVKKNLIHRQCHGKHTDFKMFMDAILLTLTRKMKLPDIEFLINLGDWPLERSTDPKKAHPMFSWCGSHSTHDIVLPTYDFTQSVMEMLGRVSLDVFSVQANTGPKWEDKIEKGLFRGRDSRQERLDLVEMSVKNPDVLDCALTNYFFFKKNEEKYGKQVKHISFFDFFKYKYQLNIDGTVAAYRLPYLLVGDGLVFKQDSEYYEHFYHLLKPWVHYIPINHNLKDVMEKIKWARNNDAEARKIQEAGTKLARENLTPDKILCNYAQSFQEYASRQTRPVEVLKSMEWVKQPEKDCVCNRANSSSKKKDEL